MWAALLILRWPIVAIAALSAIYWSIVLWRIARAVRSVPLVSAGSNTMEPQGGWPKVSVIIPAHNEAAMIGNCARSLLRQIYPNLELIFVLDRCTDETLARLQETTVADDRVVIIENDSCPREWAGKCHAAGLGAERATGDWLIFTDADVEFHPELVQASVGLAIARNLDLLSLLSTLTYRHGFERVCQPVASMNLLRMFPLDRVNDPSTNRTFANGQFMLFSRSIYESIGGHASVKDDLLEDIALSRLVHRASGRGGLFFDDRMLGVAMYESYAQFREGWKRIYIEAVKRRVDRLRKHALRLVYVAVGDPLMRLLALVVGIVFVMNGDEPFGVVSITLAVWGAIAKAGVVGRSYALAGAPRWAMFAYPLGAWHVARIMSEAASDLTARRPVRWGGREYVLEPRTAPRD